MPLTDEGSDDAVAYLRGLREEISERINDAGGRDVQIVAVTKTHPLHVVEAARAAGFNSFGESFATELVQKASALSLSEDSRCEWHFIGQLQTNKVRKVAPFTTLFQSVDRPALIDEIAKRATDAHVLIQVNLADIEGRGGVSFDEAPRLIEAARAAGIVVDGVMGVAPIAEDAEVARSFRRLRALCDAERLTHCSMGMSHDYVLAVAEGSTMVRLGSVLFGDRPKAGGK